MVKQGCRLIYGFILCVSSFSIFAEDAPIFKIVGNAPTTVYVPANGVATVSYQVTNQTTITRTLTTKTIKGVTQSKGGAGVCSRPFTLAPQQSCRLVLKIHGDTMPAVIGGGPVVCKTQSNIDPSPDPFLCAQPTDQWALSARRIHEQLPKISIAPNELNLIMMTGPQERITVRNLSLVAATNVKALNPLPAGVIQDASDCINLPPSSTCQLKFTPGNTASSPQSVAIKGINTW